jgi:formylglycine-generating enzyme required for sulfatase activity/predicted esterase
MQETHSPAFTTQIKRQIRKRTVSIPAIVLLLAAIAGAIWFFQKRSEVNRARTQSIPQIMKMAEAEDFVGAFHLARKIQPLLPDDPSLQKLWPEISRKVTIETIPEDAAIYWKDYRHPDSEWEYAGRSPLVEIPIPLGLFRWKVEKTGYQSVERSDRSRHFSSPTTITKITFHMDPTGKLPEGMIRVSGGEFSLEIPGLDHLPPVVLDDYLMDETEVTNQQYQKFVDAGGYQKKQYWKHPFIKDGRELTWEQAMAELRDSTGRSGPATWEVGHYPNGQDHFPVTGINWYEAAAYAEFAGKSLPTIYHWNRAAATWDSAEVIPRSNFSGEKLNAVKHGSALHRYGTFDMAGNAKEWCWNESGDRRFILGGSWNEPTYMFNDPDAQSPFARLTNYGFRCVKYLKPPGNAAIQPVAWTTRDFRNEKPVPDEIFQVYKSMYSYDKTDLRSRVEFTSDTIANWRTEKITFDAAYGNERMTAFLFLPKNGKPPYQTVIFFPGSGVIYQKSSNDLFQDSRNMSRISYIVESGRAMLFPIYKGTFERNAGLQSDYPKPTSAYRELIIHQYKDLARSIDYLETRKEIDQQKLAFLGSSWGGAMGLILPALEKRLKVNVLIVGGFYLQKALPEVDQINFVSRVTIPTLMLNGRHDFFLPLDTAQLPAFQLLGTPDKDKRQVLYETGHDIPRREMIREVLDWLDRYLGRV